MITCKTPNYCCYKITCLLCNSLPYVGKALNMKKRFANHLSHIRTSYTACNVADHCALYHQGIDPSSYIRIQIIETAETEEGLSVIEAKWRNKLMTWKEHNGGLNSRRD